MQTQNQKVNHPLLIEKQISLYIKREDLIHPLISGNKYRKLKYNILAAKEAKQDTLLTFGGAYSNHIAATAYAGMQEGLKTIGIIRGEELQDKWQNNATLLLAKEHGMHFKFVSREAYRFKETPEFINELKKEFKDFYLLPEGGSNSLAIKGCEEILSSKDSEFNVITTAVGTGGTISGIINASNKEQKVIGFPALKGNFLQEDIRKFASKINWELQNKYHFGGYGKVSPELIQFINAFKKETNILLDPIYTGKMVYGLLEMIKEDNFKPGTKILAIHTGGLQGIKGMNTVLKNKKQPLVIVE
ncbi:1-aminocyclopropane-1-carboxylate deaminase [Maribacter vaceletii]|uniref:1-aminocyclopropane-1-carboxylate deaminase n=1 Tax=Maribacter vaceletii TaxID=1206816 RepID=A0A495EFQ4_9FLAO|nr:pyridoxal-phosphate dependent enzyme [Maribacter vaceletii]RKR15363.1 1-aminocyclopropane-1-carboxylate deaminase [Maribacter vaceletii]